MFGKKKTRTGAGSSRSKHAKKELLDIEVSVGRANSSPKKYVLNGHRTVLDALNLAGLVKKDSEIVSVNGKEVSEDELTELELEEGDRVILVKNVEGGTK